MNPAKALRRIRKRVHPDGLDQLCRGCGGLWFGMRGEELLKDRAGQIDTGNPAEGRRTDAIGRIVCPVCGHHWALVRMVDPQQPHIRFESCLHCHGRFYDAGEFADYAEHDFRDFLLLLTETGFPSLIQLP